MKMDSWQKSWLRFGCLTILIAIISSHTVLCASLDPNSPLAAAATVNPLSHFNSTGNET